MKSGRPEPLPCNQRSVVRVIARPFPPGDGSPSVNSVQAGSRCKGRRPCVGRHRAAASLLWDCACGVCVGVTQTFRALADEPGPTMSSTGESVRLGGDGEVRACVACPVRPIGVTFMHTGIRFLRIRLCEQIGSEQWTIVVRHAWSSLPSIVDSFRSLGRPLHDPFPTTLRRDVAAAGERGG